ncbi:DUF1292 domain-containing protein [Clostridium bornimense]|uniref:DUF1292 domain-containing protein n=1 Tax=Clostridium bornimense TaxID=1216932 RepID=UPI001C1238BA|nr:DUF1292 domain-containing protein [Clostridium bornimense]MBU5315752.1 DUF1292 domain-containing protein [Clostridium bornimense]
MDKEIMKSDNCGCEEECNEKSNIVSFMTEDGEKVDLELIETVIVKGKKYILLAPVGNEDDAYVYKVVTNSEGKDELIAIEDDKELSLVMKEYEKTFA